MKTLPSILAAAAMLTAVTTAHATDYHHNLIGGAVLTEIYTRACIPFSQPHYAAVSNKLRAIVKGFASLANEPVPDLSSPEFGRMYAQMDAYVRPNFRQFCNGIDEQSNNGE